MCSLIRGFNQCRGSEAEVTFQCDILYSSICRVFILITLRTGVDMRHVQPVTYISGAVVFLDVAT